MEKQLCETQNQVRPSKLPSTENVNLMMIIQDPVVVQDPEMKELVCVPPFLAILICLPNENVQGGKKLGGDFEPLEGKSGASSRGNSSSNSVY